MGTNGKQDLGNKQSEKLAQIICTSFCSIIFVVAVNSYNIMMETYLEEGMYFVCRVCLDAQVDIASMDNFFFFLPPLNYAVSSYFFLSGLSSKTKYHFKYYLMRSSLKIHFQCFLHTSLLQIHVILATDSYKDRGFFLLVSTELISAPDWTIRQFPLIKEFCVVQEHHLTTDFEAPHVQELHRFSESLLILRL